MAVSGTPTPNSATYTLTDGVSRGSVNTGGSTRVKARAGRSYRLLKTTAAGEEVAENVIVLAEGQAGSGDLVLIVDGNTRITLEDFYAVDGASLELPSAEGVTVLDSTSPILEKGMDGADLLYAAGENQPLQGMAATFAQNYEVLSADRFAAFLGAHSVGAFTPALAVGAAALAAGGIAIAASNSGSSKAALLPADDNEQTPPTKEEQEDNEPTLPPVITIDVVTGDDIISPLEKQAGVEVSGTSENLEDGAIVTVTWGSTTQTATVFSGVWATTFASGDIPTGGSITAEAANSAGSATDTRNVAVMLPLPSLLLIDSVTGDDLVLGIEKDAGVLVSGTSINLDDGTEITLNWGTAVQTATVTNGVWSATFPAEDVPAEGATVITASANGGSLSATRDVQVATLAEITINAVATDNVVVPDEARAGVTLSGTVNGVEDGQTVTINWGTSNKTALVNGSTWTTSFAEAEIPIIGSVPVEVSVTDVDGNVATNERNVTINPLLHLSTVSNALGFIIDGEDGNDLAGSSVAQVGDVNGDGFDDLIIGVEDFDTTAGEDAGRTYVIFGGTSGVFNKINAHLAMGAIDNTVTATIEGVSYFLGGGDDTITVNTAGNVISAGSGDDLILISYEMLESLKSGLGVNGNADDMLSRIDGGSGIDTLRLNDPTMSLDLSDLTGIFASSITGGNRLDSIEVIDLGINTGNELTIAFDDILALSGTNVFNSGNGWSGLGPSEKKYQLVIMGDSTTSVNLTDDTDWNPTGTASYNSVTYNTFEHINAAVQLLVAQTVDMGLS